MRAAVALVLGLTVFLWPQATTSAAASGNCSSGTTQANTTGNGILIGAVSGNACAANEVNSTVPTGVTGSWQSASVCEVGGETICQKQQLCADGQAMQYVWFQTASGRNLTGQQQCPNLNVQPTQKLTAEMIVKAFREIPLNGSQVKISPRGGQTLVNIDTIFSTQQQRFDRTVTLLGRRVQLDITPSTFTWNYGDGTSVTTDSPGVAYDRTLPMSAYLTHEYRRADTVTPSVATTWSARWRVGGGPWRAVDGTVTIAGTPKTLVVRTATPTLVSPG